MKKKKFKSVELKKISYISISNFDYHFENIIIKLLQCRNSSIQIIGFDRRKSNFSIVNNTTLKIIKIVL